MMSWRQMQLCHFSRYSCYPEFRGSRPIRLQHFFYYVPLLPPELTYEYTGRANSPCKMAEETVGMMEKTPVWFTTNVNVPYSSHYIHVSGCDINFLKWENKTAPGRIRSSRSGLLLIHGNMAHAHWWVVVLLFIWNKGRMNTYKQHLHAGGCTWHPFGWINLRWWFRCLWVALVLPVGEQSTLSKYGPRRLWLWHNKWAWNRRRVLEPNLQHSFRAIRSCIPICCWTWT